MKDTLKIIDQEIITCRLCPRLVHYRETAPVKKGFDPDSYWRKPVPGFGDPKAWLVLLGLAPAAQGGNRTGRPFTGDLSGAFLMRSLYNCGFANQPNSDQWGDGLELSGCYITPAVKCVPPKNLPTPKEILTCSQYLHRELHALTSAKAILALGKLAFDAYLFYVRSLGHSTRGISFHHAARYTFPDLPTLYASYHPSPQNTQTGKLTAAMFESLLKEIKGSL